MIKRLKYPEIDFNKYSACIESAAQYKYTAERSFLDIVSGNNWELLVYKDYEAVMPVPYIFKYGLRFVLNPNLCQQLGIFSKKDMVGLNEAFLAFFRQNYRIWYYAFNDSNGFRSSLATRKNFLMLPEVYEKVYHNYSPKRKRKLRIDENVRSRLRIDKDMDLGLAIPFINDHMAGAGNKKDLKSFIGKFTRFYQVGDLRFYGFFHDGQLINLLALHISKSTVALLGTFNDRKFLKLNGASILIDHAIKDYIETHVFDFEGSEVPAVEEFFRGFRPQLASYPYILHSRKDLLLNLLGK